MTTDQPTSPESPSQWLMVSGSETEPSDLRLYQQLADIPAQEQPQPGSAWFIGITRVFTGCPDPRDALERVGRAWFEHSGLAPLLAQVDADAEAVTFWKAVEVDDPTEAIRLTAQGIARAIEHVELDDGTVRPGFSVEVIAEQDGDDQR